MEKRLEIRFNENNVSINYSVLINSRKSIPNIADQDLSNQTAMFAKDLKGAKGFEKFAIDYYGEDWYEDIYFKMPCCIFEKGKSKIYYRQQESIPKEWFKLYSMTIKELNNITLFKRFIKVVGIQITDVQLKEIRKAIKDKKYHYMEL